MAGKRAQSPVGGVPQTRRTQAADAPGDPAVSGARRLPGVSRVALGESRMTQPGRVGLDCRSARGLHKVPSHTPRPLPGAGAPRGGSRAGGGGGRGRGEAWFLRRPGLPRLPASARATAPSTQRVGVRVGRR